MSSTSICLISGGLDSCVATALAFSRKQNPVLALSISYGQRHERELKSAADVAAFYSLPHHIISIEGLQPLIKSASALVNPDETLPSSRSVEDMSKDIPRSYVPGRNTIMLALAQSVAEAIGANRIFTGFNAVDYSGYPDCRPQYVAGWNNLAGVATAEAVKGRPVLCVAPIIEATKEHIVKLGVELGAPLNLTWSCYAGGSHPCGTCDSCIIRRNAFKANNLTDPIGPYADELTKEATSA